MSESVGVATVNGFQMHYRTAGSGDPLFLLHGCPQSSYEWHKVMPALAEHFTVIAPDIRGLGDSAPTEGGYGLDTLADDVFQLAHLLGYERIRVMGHDHGCSIGYVLACSHPDLVERFMVLDGVPNIATLDAEMNWQAARRFWHICFLGGPTELAERLILSNLELYLRFFMTSHPYAYDTTAITDRDMAEYLRVYSRPGSVRALTKIYAAIFDENLALAKQCNEKLKMPVKVFGSDRVLGELAGELWSQVAEDIEADVIPDCGHWVAEEQPDFVIREALAFFR